MDDDAILIPVDVSGEEETFPTSYEELVEKAIVFYRDEGGFTNKTMRRISWQISVFEPPPWIFIYFSSKKDLSKESWLVNLPPPNVPPQ